MSSLNRSRTTGKALHGIPSLADQQMIARINAACVSMSVAGDTSTGEAADNGVKPAPSVNGDDEK